MPAYSGPLDLLQPPGDRRLAVRVQKDAQRAIRQGHPWVYASAITELKGEGRPGDLAVIFDDYRRFLAVGLYDPTSPLRIRILHAGSPATIDQQWLAEQLSAAASWRASLQESGTDGYRLVHGENDGLPGLIVDRYADRLAIKLYTPAWIPWLPSLCAALAATIPHTGSILRLSRELIRQPEWLFGLRDGMVLTGGETSGTVLFHENGLCFEADLAHGQKTGFFLDQRDNRARVERLAAGRSTLNVFSYTGGFSLYAARGGAPSVVSLDASQPALAAAQRNFALNEGLPSVSAARHELLCDDAFDALIGLAQQQRKFDLVIVDPPAFAKKASEIPSALQAYQRLTTLALQVLSRGGILVLASCSSRVSAPAFFAAVSHSAAVAHRPLTELERSGHAIDHPVAFPEAAYLKCLFATA
jgi:23S rRNA (cytosine1962-C5)-methyltransferase